MSVETDMMQASYRQGFTDAMRQFHDAVITAMSRIQAPGVSADWRVKCVACGGPLEIGQPAEYVNSDAYGFGRYRHLGGLCPVPPSLPPIPLPEMPPATAAEELPHRTPGATLREPATDAEDHTYPGAPALTSSAATPPSSPA